MKERRFSFPRIAATVAGVALLPQPVPAEPQRGGDKLPEKIEPWLDDFDSALQRSLDRNAPLLILSILEGEETSDRVRNEIYHGKQFLKASRDAIVLLTNNGTHPSKKIEIETEDGGKLERQVCSVFETPTCMDHQRSQDRVYQEFHMNGDFKMPHLIAVLPGGKIHDRFFDEIQIADAVRIAEAAKKAAGPCLTDAELAEVQGKLTQLASFEKARLWVSAWRAATRVLEITAAPIHAGPAQAGLERALARMRADVEHALKLLEEGQVEDGYLRLLALCDEHEGTPLAKDTRETLKKVERDKRYEDAIEALQRRQEAEELWKKVEEALAEGKERIAQRHAQKLIDRFADTPAGRRAAERFPELVPPDGAGTSPAGR